MSYQEAYGNYHASTSTRRLRARPRSSWFFAHRRPARRTGARPRPHRRQALRARAASIDKCCEIINGLSSSLDFEGGGEVVANLANLYDFCAQRLQGAGIKMDPAMVDEVVGVLTTIRQGWQGVQERNAYKRCDRQAGRRLAASAGDRARLGTPGALARALAPQLDAWRRAVRGAAPNWPRWRACAKPTTAPPRPAPRRSTPSSARLPTCATTRTAGSRMRSPATPNAGHEE
jgi:flagellar protein FliS